MHVPSGCTPGLQVMVLSVLKDLKHDTFTTYTFCMGKNRDVFEIFKNSYKITDN
jgi:hypothetical protein